MFSKEVLCCETEVFPIEAASDGNEVLIRL